MQMHQHSDDSEGEEGGREEASISGSDDDGEGAEGGEAEAAQGEGKGKQGPKKVGADDYDHMDDWIDDSGGRCCGTKCPGGNTCQGDVLGGGMETQSRAALRPRSTGLGHG